MEAQRQGRRLRTNQLETSFDALGPAAQQFHLCLQRQPVRTSRHIRRLLDLARTYGRDDVLRAIEKALHYQTYDAAYVETLLQQERRRRELPSPTPLCPQRRELIDKVDFEEPDPASYERLCDPPWERDVDLEPDPSAENDENRPHEPL